MPCKQIPPCPSPSILFLHPSQPQPTDVPSGRNANERSWFDFCRGTFWPIRFRISHLTSMDKAEVKSPKPVQLNSVPVDAETIIPFYYCNCSLLNK